MQEILACRFTTRPMVTWRIQLIFATKTTILGAKKHQRWTILHRAPWGPQRWRRQWGPHQFWPLAPTWLGLFRQIYMNIFSYHGFVQRLGIPETYLTISQWKNDADLLDMTICARQRAGKINIKKLFRREYCILVVDLPNLEYFTWALFFLRYSSVDFIISWPIRRNLKNQAYPFSI